MRSSRYEARGKFGEHERYVRVARGVAKFSPNFLSASYRTLTYGPIVNETRAVGTVKVHC